MKEVPEKDRPEVAGGVVATEYPEMPCAPIKWPPEIEDGPTFPEIPCTSPSESYNP